MNKQQLLKRDIRLLVDVEKKAGLIFSISPAEVG